MVQFNLLPDIKIQYLKARRQKHLVLFVSTVAIIASIAVLLLLASYVFGVQRKSIHDLTNDIQTASEELQNTPDLNKILTVQNQLNSLPDLHNSKPAANRVFGYINQATPLSASISRLEVNFEAGTMSLTGSANSLETVNKFVDTLKFTNFITGSNGEPRRAFTDVVLANFGRDTEGANYTINLSFDQEIFSQQADVELSVPNIITTRSEVEQPGVLFEE